MSERAAPNGSFLCRLPISRSAGFFRTRWTLTVCFKALPWRPVPCFTGISEYTVDDQARVVRQVDYWDSINLVGGEGGGGGDGTECICMYLE